MYLYRQKSPTNQSNNPYINLILPYTISISNKETCIHIHIDGFNEYNELSYFKKKTLFNTRLFFYLSLKQGNTIKDNLG